MPTLKNHCIFVTIHYGFASPFFVVQLIIFCEAEAIYLIVLYVNFQE